MDDPRINWTDAFVELGNHYKLALRVKLFPLPDPVWIRCFYEQLEQRTKKWSEEKRDWGKVVLEGSDELMVNRIGTGPKDRLLKDELDALVAATNKDAAEQRERIGAVLKVFHNNS